MSEPAASDSELSDLPRLRIHHLLVLTTIFSVVMTVHLGFWRFLRSSQPDAVMPEISGGISILIIAQFLSISVYVATALFGLAWRRRGIVFPSQPGHWVAIYLAIAWAYEVVLSFTMFLPTQGFVHDSMVWVRFLMHFAFHCIAAIFWIIAYYREDSRIWKWGWAAMALRSAFSVSFFVFRIGVKCIEWLVEVLWYNSQVDLQSLRFLWSFSGMWKLWLTSYALLAFLGAAMILDYRYSRRRHWSHWLVLILAFISNVVLISYYHLVL